MKELLLLPLLAAATSSVIAADAKITIQRDKPSHPVAPGLFGVFFEDIKLSADGGLYPELVRNRSFEDAETPQSWTVVSKAGAEIAIDTSKPLNPLNWRSLRVQLDGATQLVNEGYWGMNIVKGDGYNLTFAACTADCFDGNVTAKLLSADGRELTTGQVSGITPETVVETIRDLGDTRTLTLRLAPGGGYAATVSPRQ